MHFDFRQVSDTQSFTSIPPGSYVCRIAEVREGLSRDGFVRWSMRLEVAEGPFAGKNAAWDSLTWSERGIPRVKKVLSSLGFDLSAPVEIDAPDLVRRCARVHLQNEEREDPATGQRTIRLRVPYAGYERLENGAFLDLGAEQESGYDPFGDDAPSDLGPVHGPAHGLQAASDRGSEAAAPTGALDDGED